MTLSRYHRPGLIAWVCFLATFATLIGLGCWQLERLAWKQGLLGEAEAGRVTEPLVGLPSGGDVPMFRRVRITGIFGAQEFHVTPRYFRDTLGYHLFVPFVLDDGRHVMVNRGWVPAAKKDSDTRPGSATPIGEQTLTVIVREGAERHRFTPDSQPEKNIWFGRDIARMGTAIGHEVLPYSVDVLGEQNPAILPVPSNGEVKLRNDHLQYAITWFLIALAALVIFVVFHRR